MYKYYGGIEKFYDCDCQLFLNCLEHAVQKENEIPKLIEMIFNKILGTDFFEQTKSMRTSDEILKDYGLGGDENGTNI